MPLPPYFVNLSEETKTDFESLAGRLYEDPTLTAAAGQAWESIPEEPGELMMRCFLLQGPSPCIAHWQARTIPSITFVSEYFKDPSTPLPSSLRAMASNLLLTAVVKPKPESGDSTPNYVFDDTEGVRKREEERGGLLDWDNIFSARVGEEAASEGSDLEEDVEGAQAVKKQRTM
jgi:hypothetical protein